MGLPLAFCQSAQRKDLIGILADAAVANFHIAELPFDYPEDMLHLRSYPRFVTVLCLLHFVDVVLVAVAFVCHVLRPRRDLADCSGLSAIGLIAPDLGLFAMQQVR